MVFSAILFSHTATHDDTENNMSHESALNKPATKPRKAKKLERHTVQIPSKVHRRLARHARSNGQTLGFVTTKAVLQFLDSQ